MYGGAQRPTFMQLRGRLMLRGTKTHPANPVLCGVYADLIQKYQLERHKTKPERRQQKIINCLSKLVHIFKLRQR